MHDNVVLTSSQITVLGGSTPCSVAHGIAFAWTVRATALPGYAARLCGPHVLQYLRTLHLAVFVMTLGYMLQYAYRFVSWVSSWLRGLLVGASGCGRIKHRQQAMCTGCSRSGGLPCCCCTMAGYGTTVC